MTLLEVILVLVIISVITGFAMLSIGEGTRGHRIEQEARRLQALFQLAGEMAVLQGREIGVMFEGREYRFVVLKDQEWHPLKEEDLLRRRTLPDGLQLRVFSEGISRPADTLDAPDYPQVVFYSSGVLSPFEVLLTIDGSVAPLRLIGALDGTVEVQTQEKTQLRVRGFASLASLVA